jgi:hypothetical protein
MFAVFENTGDLFILLKNHPFSINKTNCHDITEILLKVALNTIILNLSQIEI